MNGRNDDRGLGHLTGRRVAASIAVAFLAVLLLWLSSGAGVAYLGEEEFAVGEAGGSLELIGTASFVKSPSSSEASGALEITAAGEVAQYCVLCYNGELCCGPARLTP